MTDGPKIPAPPAPLIAPPPAPSLQVPEAATTAKTPEPVGEARVTEATGLVAGPFCIYGENLPTLASTNVTINGRQARLTSAKPNVIKGTTPDGVGRGKTTGVVEGLSFDMVIG